MTSIPVQLLTLCQFHGLLNAGKTTQLPQFVIDDMIQHNMGADANIIVTQPRRISAVGVADRISSERCEKVGETVGYSIRLESRRSSKTRLLLCTTGLLLRRLQVDPDLASVSHGKSECLNALILLERGLQTSSLLIQCLLMKCMNETSTPIFFSLS